MYPYQSLVVVTVLLQLCLASLPQQDIEKLFYPPYGSRRGARTRTSLGLVLIVDNKSGFTLADQKIYLDDGGLGSQYVPSVKTSIMNISRFGPINKVRPYKREVFFFHNLCQNCKDSSGVLSWTVSRQCNSGLPPRLLLLYLSSSHLVKLSPSGLH